jgi:hypothetical protein
LRDPDGEGEPRAPSRPDQAPPAALAVPAPSPRRLPRRARRAARHVGRHAHRLLRWLGAIAAVLILLVGFAIWRLMQGPIELDRLVPYVQAAIDRAEPGLGVTVSGVRVGIDRATHQLDLWVENVHIALPNGDPLANFPEMATSLNLGSLLRGQLAPTRLVVQRPVVRLMRDASGAISLRIGEGEAGDSGRGLIAALTAPAASDHPLGLLRQVRIHDATVIVDDRLLGRRWQANHLDANVERSPDGIEGDLAVAVAIGNTPSELHASYRYMAARRKLDLALSAEGVEPSALAPLLPALEPLWRFHFPLSGTLATQYDFDEHKFEGVRLDLGIGDGWIDTDQLPAGRLALTGGELHAVYAPEERRVRLDRLELDLGGGVQLSLAGAVDGVSRGLLAAGFNQPRELPARLDIALSHVPLARIDTFWPLGFSHGGRRWILANIPGGTLDQVAARLDFKIDPAARAAQLAAAHATIRFHDLTVNYFTGLPLAQNVSGTATVSDKEIDITATAGSVKGQKLVSGAMKITDLGAPVETLTIDLTLAGTLRDALEILDGRPLRYAHAIGLDPAAVGGRAETQLHFGFPLLADLKLDAVDYAAKATLSGVSVAKVALERNLADGNFVLDLTRAGVRVTGDGRFDGTPAKLDAAVFFHPKSGPHATYRVAMTLDEAAQRRLNYDFAPDRISGPVGLDLTYSLLQDGRATAAADLDLRGASIEVAEAGWRKPAGQPGTAKIALAFDHETIGRRVQVEARAAGLDARVALTLDESRRHIDRANIRHLTIGHDDLSGVVARRGAGWHADLRGTRFDLRPLFKESPRQDGVPPAPPLTISAQLDRVDFGTGRSLRSVVAQLSREAGHWQQMQIDGRHPDGHRLALRLGGALGPSALQVTSDDLGATLRLLDIADNVVGGKLSLTGQLTEANGRPVLQAQFVGSDYSLVRASTATRILSMASLDGLAAMLSGSGIPFSSLRGDFTYRDGAILLDRLIAYGGALGITAKGKVDIDRDTLDLSGTIAPAHTLNSVLGNLPLIGSILMGGEGQSLFAANYRVTGPTAEPSISVNPLSALAPGFLRRIFDFDMSGGELPPQPP